MIPTVEKRGYMTRISSFIKKSIRR